MFLPEEGARYAQVTVSPESGGQCTLDVYSMTDDAQKAQAGWTLHITASICHADTQKKHSSASAARFRRVRVTGHRPKGPATNFIK